MDGWMFSIVNGVNSVYVYICHVSLILSGDSYLNIDNIFKQIDEPILTLFVSVD